MSDSEKLKAFGQENAPVHYVETVIVKDGVACDVYSFDEDNTRDLAVVTVRGGEHTPLQKVLSGVTTTEGYVSGRGALTVSTEDGQQIAHVDFDENNQGAIVVEVGQIMQWTAHPDEDLVFYEVCVPPYEDGRFENLSE